MDTNNLDHAGSNLTYCPFKAPVRPFTRIGRSSVQTLRFDQRPGMSLVCASLPQTLASDPEQWHCPSYLQIVHVESGNLRLIDHTNKSFELNDGDWFVLKPSSENFKFQLSSDLRVHWMEFNQTSSQSLVGFSDVLNSRIQNPEIAFFASGQSGGKLRAIASEISNFTGKSPRESLVVEAKTLEWLALLLDHPVFSPCKIVIRSKHDRDELALNAAKRILETRLDEAHTLEKISREIHLNEFKLKKGFRERFNTSVFSYLRQKRMERAYEILSRGSSSVIEVANAVGYSNASHFARAFKEEHGVNPSDLLA